MAVIVAAGLLPVPGAHAIDLSGRKVDWGKFRPDDLGEKVVRYSDTGTRRTAPAPRPGVHPRILFGPEDLPDIRRRLKETRCGREIWLNIRAWTAHLNGAYDKGADYARVPDDILGGAERMRGARVPLQRGRGIAAEYRKLIEGKKGELDGIKISLGSVLTAVMALEAFECMVTEDAPRARRLAKAMANLVAGRLGAITPKSHPGIIGGHNMAFCYDFVYDYMTGPQRRVVREGLAKVTKHRFLYGTFLAPHSTTSNWCTLDGFLVMTALAIEGEAGYNEDLILGAIRANRNFLSYGWYASGIGYEGGGKNYQLNTTHVALAKRGADLTAHPHVRAYGTRLLPHMMQPFGYGFTAYDDWGGTGWDTIRGGYRFNFNDAVGLKWIFPDDAAVDFVWRNWIGDNYQHVPTRPEGYYNAMIMAAAFASDWKPGPWDPAALDLPATFFCPERGLMVTRSEWSRDAVYLQLHCRQDLGGHTSAERNSFQLSALGRIWAHIRTTSGGSSLGKSNETRFHSCVLIDDVGQCKTGSGSNPEPGRVVAFRDGPEATFVCGDAKNAYDWTWGGRSAPRGEPDPMLARGWEKVLETPNDFRFKKGAEAYLNTPFYEKDHWLHPGHIRRAVKRPWNPVERAFRTAGVVRGPHSYALIMDDIQKDGEVHNYKWLMQLSADLEVAKNRLGYGYDEENRIGDITLCGRACGRDESAANRNYERQPRKGDPLLLVRALDCARDMKLKHRSPAVGYVEQYMAGIRWYQPGKRLVIPSWSVAPGFKVMLFPYRYGDELPKTSWDRGRTRLTIEWKGQRDEFEFRAGADGRTRFTLARAGRRLVDFD
jgi:hypothetical protein